MTKYLRIGLLEVPKVNVSINGESLCYSARDMAVGDTFLQPGECDEYFEIEGVTIGKEFHWQRLENQRFKGTLILRNDGKLITAINVIDIEEYLKSVISSEMNANASLEFLKAHAIISRTWVTNRLKKRRSEERNHLGKEGRREESKTRGNVDGMTETDGERIRWYDDRQHTGFDVCADDHCQRYQGITRITNPTAIEAVESTRGQVLTHNGDIIDARFSKCCGGAFETFENCWQPTHKPCLEAGMDTADTKATLPDLTDEANAREWIEGRPDAFCNTDDEKVLSQVLNDYDLTTKDFYRWRQDYSQQELSDIVRARSGIDFGTVSDLIPIQRGVSGRITRLKIVGSKRIMVIGKELEIRKTLSTSHLYSSAFTVKKDNDRFILHGAGWGHGVGLCQIGAAMMAHLGYNHRQILAHYYPGSKLTTQN